MNIKVSADARKIPGYILSLIILLGLFSYSQANADTSDTLEHGTQLAYFIGYHSYTGGYRQPVIYPPIKYTKGGAYWTGWRYVGYGCRQTCLIDKVTHNSVRCNRLCF